MIVFDHMKTQMTIEIKRKKVNINRYVISNCNSVKQGFINIYDKCLNIKYGFNGTGKSTIAKAIAYFNDKDKLNSLTPYNATTDENSRVDVDVGVPYKHVMIFNEEYVKQFIFTNKGSFDNSFEVLLKNEACEQLVLQTENQMESLYSQLSADSLLESVYSLISSLDDKIKNTNNQIDKRGSVGELINGYGDGFFNHKELLAYKSYYESPFDVVSEWAKWRCSGISLMENKSMCPFCMEKFKDETKIHSQNNLIKKVFNESAMDLAEKLREFFEKGLEKDLLKKDSVETFRKYLGDNSKSKEIESGLNALVCECSYLKDKIGLINSLKPGCISRDQLDNLKSLFESCKIEKCELTRFFSTKKLIAYFDSFNTSISSLVTKINELKMLFSQYSVKLSETIRYRTKDINEFLLLAGYPYCIEIVSDVTNHAIVKLKPIDVNISVSEPGEHLSWGEKNCFALAMFMFEACSCNADLVILDDPILSFDKNKKFALMERLFSKKERDKSASFNQMTTLLFTHDLQPIIDYVYHDFFNKRHINMVVTASFLNNNKGCIDDGIYPLEINKNDIKSVVEYTRDLFLNREENLAIRLVSLRRYIELIGEKHSNISYDYLSSIIHDRDEPTKKNNEPSLDSKSGNIDIKLTNDEITIAEKKINNELDLTYDYKKFINELSFNNLCPLIRHYCSFEKKDFRFLIIARLVLNRSDKLKEKITKDHLYLWKYVCEYLHIEDDYLFQLNPDRYPNYPSKIYSELVEFFKEELK